MTERKPAGVSFETWVDVQIREAKERGEFDNLPGHGQPIAGLDGPLDELWWVKQLLAREEIEVLPGTIALRKARDHALEHIGEAPSEAAVREIVAALNERIREANRMPASGPPSNMMPMDIERVVERWRAARQHAAEG